MANIVFDFLHNYETGERRESEPANAYQYDEGHVLEAILPAVVTAVELHYWIRGMEEAEAYNPTSITPNADGSCTILGNVPNKYFETNGELRIYIVINDADASITTYEGKLHICQRSMPDDYVDDDPENEATRILTEARAAAATATAAAETAQDVADSIPADYTQLSEDVSTLKEDLSLVVEKTFDDITSTLNWSVNGYYNSGNLSGNPQNVDEAKTAFITVSGGETFRVSGKTYCLQKLFCVYGENDTLLAVYDSQNAVVDYTDSIIELPDNAVKVAVSYYRPAYLSGLKIEKLETKRMPVEKDELTILGKVKPTNYYDYNSAILGEYINYNNGTPSANAGMCYAYVPVVAGNYVVTVAQNYFGNTAARVPYFDANKQYLGYIQGEFISQDIPNLAIVSIVVPSSAKYITVSLRTYYRYRGMVSKGSSVPTEFATFFDGYDTIENNIKVNDDNVVGFSKNPLYLKTVAFDGDSICHGISASDGKSGWAGRIGTANGMNWANFGVSGGTITNNHSHCIMNAIEDIHTFMPTLDYYIFDGGTNDADILKMDGIGTFTADDYSGTYDTDTFSGAFETLLYNAFTYYPTTKIGYIVAQKMGKTGNANYPIRKAYFERAIEICKKWGVPYIDLWNGSHLNPNLESMYDSSLDAEGNIEAGKMYIDGQHLTPNGYDYITPIIEAWMKTL